MAKLSHRINVRADSDRVYQALMTAGGLEGWFTPHVEGGMGEGQEAEMSFPGKEGFRWRFSQLKPGAHARWDCLTGPGAAPGTAVIYTLTTEDGRTVVQCDHEGWPEEHDALATCNTLWGVLMGRLKEFSETGKANPLFT